MEKTTRILIVIIYLCLVVCTSNNKIHVYKNSPMHYYVSIHDNTMYIEHKGKTLKLKNKNGEYYYQNKVFLSNKRTIHITQKVDYNIYKIISIQKVMNDKSDTDFKPGTKDIFARKEYYVNSYEKDGEYPISEIDYDKNYKIIRIKKLENIDYTTSIK